MPRVEFSYDIEKDAWSWVLIAKDKDDLWGLSWRNQIAHIPDDLLEKIEKSSFADAQTIVRKHIEEDPKRKYKESVMLSEIRTLEDSWRIVEKDFFEILEMVTQKPIFTTGFSCYLTTGFMCPYNEKEEWFMVSMWHSIPFSITTVCHEIMHLQFLHYYKNALSEKGLSEKQIEDLKEALTVILNSEDFEKVVLSNDSGYPEHQELREKIRKSWGKERDFQKMLDSIVAEMKDR